MYIHYRFKNARIALEQQEAVLATLRKNHALENEEDGFKAIGPRTPLMVALRRVRTVAKREESGEIVLIRNTKRLGRGMLHVVKELLPFINEGSEVFEEVDDCGAVRLVRKNGRLVTRVNKELHQAERVVAKGQEL